MRWALLAMVLASCAPQVVVKTVTKIEIKYVDRWQPCMTKYPVYELPGWSEPDKMGNVILSAYAAQRITDIFYELNHYIARQYRKCWSEMRDSQLWRRR